MVPILKLLPWETNYFGFRFGRLTIRGRTTARKISTVLAKSRYRFVLSRVLTTDTYAATALENSGFRVKDIRVHLDIELKDLREWERNAETEFRAYRARDVPSLRKIASGSFRLDHFHQDERFDPGTIDRMYSLWIDKCVKEKYFIETAHIGGKLAGFVASKNDSGSYYIELVAVGERFRGRGLATDLVAYSLEKAASKFARATVGVQLSNVAAVRVYERLGFRLSSSEYTFHWWRN